MNDELFHHVHELIAVEHTDKLYKHLVTQIVEYVRADNGTLLLLEGKKLSRKYSTHNKLILPRKKGFSFTALQQGTPMILNPEDVWRIHPEHEYDGTKSFIVLPILYKSHKKGVLHLTSTKEAYFTPEQKQILGSYCLNSYFLLRNLEMYKDLEEKLKRQNLFTSITFHEIKAPLTVLNSFAELFLKQLEKKQLPKLANLAIFHSEVNRMNRIVQNYLLPTGNIFATDETKFCIRDLLQRAVYQVAITYPTHNIKFLNTLTTPMIIKGDQDKLLEAMINLLTNAAKFSPPEKTILVKLQKIGDTVVIDISDEGDGIAEKDLKHIFSRFYRGKNAKKVDGMGLGLYLVKNIIKEHNGTISIASKIAQGTNVTITLPVKVV